MEAILQDFIRTLQVGEPRRFKNLEVFPLFPSRNVGPDFLALKQALEQRKIVITETTESGSVPQLKVTNRGNEFVLLIDGEELMGAKQNRVLNTSILIKGQSEITIPVSCTEHGRWSSISRWFWEGHGAFRVLSIATQQARAADFGLHPSAAAHRITVVEPSRDTGKKRWLIPSGVATCTAR